MHFFCKKYIDEVDSRNSSDIPGGGDTAVVEEHDGSLLGLRRRDAVDRRNTREPKCAVHALGRTRAGRLTDTINPRRRDARHNFHDNRGTSPCNRIGCSF